MVIAGLQRDVKSGARDLYAARGRIAQGHDFGMRTTCLLGKSMADDLLFRIDDDAADTRVGRGKKKRLSCLLKRFSHVIGVVVHCAQY